jgi:hypothetical protein
MTGLIAVGGVVYRQTTVLMSLRIEWGGVADCAVLGV